MVHHDRWTYSGKHSSEEPNQPKMCIMLCTQWPHYTTHWSHRPNGTFSTHDCISNHFCNRRLAVAIYTGGVRRPWSGAIVVVFDRFWTCRVRFLYSQASRKSPDNPSTKLPMSRSDVSDITLDHARSGWVGLGQVGEPYFDLRLHNAPQASHLSMSR